MLYVAGSSGSVELFPASLKLKHLMSYTNEPLPSNVNKSLEHDGNEKEDRESCFSTEILDSEEKGMSQCLSTFANYNQCHTIA